MALTVLLSFRRLSWFGLAAAVVLAAVAIAPRSRRAAALGPVILGMGAAIVVFARERFAGSGNLVSRIFADFVGQNGPTRQEEWALAWQTVAKNPLAGDIIARRGGSSFAFWDTRIVHSAILYSWMKFGLIGLVSLAVVPVACVYYAYKAVRTRCPEEHIAFGVLGLAPFVLLNVVMACPLIELRTLLMLVLAGSLGVMAARREGEAA
jgi:O-antigen ligase